MVRRRGHGEHFEPQYKFWDLATQSQTVSTVEFFFLAMAMYPEVQRKAQTEIDAAVGPLRLPDFNDRDSLPYINAMMKELLRWHPVSPQGILIF
jgi:cytochrome P450